MFMTGSSTDAVVLVTTSCNWSSVEFSLTSSTAISANWVKNKWAGSKSILCAQVISVFVVVLVGTYLGSKGCLKSSVRSEASAPCLFGPAVSDFMVVQAARYISRHLFTTPRLR